MADQIAGIQWEDPRPTGVQRKNKRDENSHEHYESQVANKGDRMKLFIFVRTFFWKYSVRS